MELNTNREYDLYNDIKLRCKGEIYIGVVGPVRTGKSTFIKRFMEEMVLPNMSDEFEKERAVDELPQSAGGKTVTTTEPKFIPKETARIKLQEGMEASVRLIDCVGYMVDGAAGHMEDSEERMVKTPWAKEEISFTKAAEIGTRKVIQDHSTIGIVVTCDGSFGEIERVNYIKAEDQTIKELKKLKKPFVVLVNTVKPYGEEARQLSKELAEKHHVTVVPVNCKQLDKEDILQIFEKVLCEFPISSMEFYLPKWVNMLPMDYPLKAALVNQIKDLMDRYETIKDVRENDINLVSEYVTASKLDGIDLANGCVRIWVQIGDNYYYQMLSEMVDEPIQNEYQLLSSLKDMAKMKKEYQKVIHAMEAVRNNGYGVVSPERSEIRLDKPEVIRHGNKYGVKIHAESPSVHLIKANIETEISPIVGSESQANDLIKFIETESEQGDGIWETNIFGKSVEQLVYDGINSKIAMIGNESQLKLQETMQKIVNESNGGMVCIII